MLLFSSIPAAPIRFELLFDFLNTELVFLFFFFFSCFSRSQPVLDDSSGKSGAKFYQSYDKLFIIKTLTSEEVERMHSFLKHYHPVSIIKKIYRNVLVILEI